MKKFFYAFAALSLLFAATSCDEDGKINLDDIVLDGFYVYGEATGSDKVQPANAMSGGSNEVDKTARTGMYEKYVYLQAGKDFALIENSNGNKKFYGANLVEVNYGYDAEDPDCKNFADNPNMKILQGQLIIGETAPKMQVKETGLYHIVLDNNQNGDLAQGAQIIVHKADFGVRGGCNGWGFTAGEQTVGKDGAVTFTWNDLDFAANGEFKFASCNGWKINLDEDGIVKAEISLGVTDGKLSNVGGNISVGPKAGLYKIVLNFTPKAGAVADSFSYSVELTQESNLPEACYLIGEGINGWNFPGDAVATIAAHSENGVFWAIRYIEAGKGFKFSQINTGWGKDFTGLGTDAGYTVTDNNCFVAESGLYMIEIDYSKNSVNLSKAEVYGMGDAFGNWDEGKNAFTVEGQTFVATAAAAGDLRMYAKSAIMLDTNTWWHREFNIYDGKIVYRAAGADQTAVPVTANQKVTLDFNAGTGSIK